MSAPGVRDDTPIEELSGAAALAMLARVLGAEQEEVAFLADVPVAQLRALRRDLEDRLHRGARGRLERVATASGMVPPALGARIGESWFGPVLCARLVPLIDPRRVEGFAAALTTPFLADVTARTDPRAVGGIVEHLPLQVMRDIATELDRRGDHLTLSTFVGHLPPATVAAILEALHDDADVVRVARYVEDTAALSPVVALLPDARCVGLVEAVAEADLWPPALHLFGRLAEPEVARLATLVADRPALLRATIVGLDRHDLWAQGLAVMSAVDDAHLAQVASVLVRLDDDLVLAAITALDRHDLWAQGLAILTRLDGDDVARLAGLLPRLEPSVLEAVLAGFAAQDLWAEGLRILAGLDGPQVGAVATALVAVDDDVVDGAVDAALATDLWEPLVRAGVAAQELPPEVRATLSRLVEARGVEVTDAFDAAATRLGHDGLRVRLLGA